LIVLTNCRHLAGKDRTGVLAALILEITGASREFIAQDYALTRIGMEQARDELVTLLRKDMGCGFEEPGMEDMVGVKGETMVRFLEWVEERWGGAEGYLRSELGFENNDVNIIKENLRGDQR
jgi:protein tyrosine/serine phosphatase